jgi:hypothetical protein
LDVAEDPAAPGSPPVDGLWDEQAAAIGEEPSQDETFYLEGEAPTQPTVPRTAEQVKAGVQRAIETYARDGGRPGVADPTQEADPWANGPLLAFCALVHRKSLKEKEKQHWPGELARWAKEWEASPQETADAIKAITQSELEWQTYKTPFSDSFKETMDMMIDRLRNNMPVNARGQRKGGSSGPRREPITSDDTIVIGGVT